MKTYLASLCYQGLLGGAVYIGDDRVSYRTGKITVPPEIRALDMPFCRIRGVERTRLAFLPTVTFRMQNGREWQLLVFGRGSFLKNLEKAMEEYV